MYHRRINFIHNIVLTAAWLGLEVAVWRGSEKYVLLSQQTFVLMKTSRRRLEDLFRLRLQKTSSRRLQDFLIKTNMFALALRLQKTSCSRPIYSSWPYVFKTSSRRFQVVLQIYLQGFFKRYHQVKLFLWTHLWEAFNVFLRRSFPNMIIYRRICPGNTTSKFQFFNLIHL